MNMTTSSLIELIEARILPEDTGGFGDVDTGMNLAYKDCIEIIRQHSDAISYSENSLQPPKLAQREISVLSDEDVARFTPMDALRNLIYWKNYKDQNGKDALYEEGQNKAWQIARAASTREPVSVSLEKCVDSLQKACFADQQGGFNHTDQVKAVLDAAGVAYVD